MKREVYKSLRTIYLPSRLRVDFTRAAACTQ